MSKAFAALYAFNASARTVTIGDLATVTPESLILITNTTTGDVIYQFNRPELGATFSGNTVTLEFDTTAMSNTDRLQIIYDDMQMRQVIGNGRKAFRDGFAVAGTQPNPNIWNIANNGGHIITQGGNSQGSVYLRISLNPINPDTEVTLTSRETFRMPMRIGAGLSTSQRVVGQEIFWGIVGDDGAGGVDTSTTIPGDVTITGSTLSVTTNVATITAANHGLNGTDRIIIFGAPDSRCNVGPGYLTVVDKDTITVPLTLGNGTYNTTGAVIRIVDSFRGAYNGAGYLWESATTTVATAVVRRNGCKPRTIVNQTIGGITGSQTNPSPYTDSFNPATTFEIESRFDETALRTIPTDSLSSPSGILKAAQVPDEDRAYHLHLRARNLKNFSVPVGRITNATKSGSTTTTITTDVPHGLTTSDFIQVIGIRDQTNFANLTTAAAPLSIIDATHFTIAVGVSNTITSAGGAVWRVQAGNGISGLYNLAVQSISRTGNVMSVVATGTWTTPLPGEYVYLYGLDSAAAYEGGYKVLRVNGTTLELASTGADFTSINTGGAAMRMTDVRIHFARMLDYTRLVTEVVGGRGNQSDLNNAVPVALAGGAALAVIQAASTLGASTNLWSAAGYAAAQINDVTSAAVTTTTTSSTVTPSANIGAQSQQFTVVVSAVSGTTPTMDVVVQESPDGSWWQDVYHFPRITATGTYMSAQVPNVFGNRYRYVRTIAGTTPSFTHAINRLVFSHRSPLIKQFYDRTQTLTSGGSTTNQYLVEGCRHVQMAINIGAVTTTAPAIKLQGCDDHSNANWYDIGTPLTAVASSTVVANFVDVLPKYIRAFVSTAGVGVTAGYVSFRAIGY